MSKSSGRSLYEIKLDLKKMVLTVIKAETCESKCFYLVEITPEELSGFRKQRIPSFVLKIDGNLYYSQIPKCINFIASKIFGKHRCTNSHHTCVRLSAARDEEGGCAKVRNYSKGIEKYPWIKKGYETFGTMHDSFIVIKCEHYRKTPPRNIDNNEMIKIRTEFRESVFENLQILQRARE